MSQAQLQDLVEFYAQQEHLVGCYAQQEIKEIQLGLKNASLEASLQMWQKAKCKTAHLLSDIRKRKKLA